MDKAGLIILFILSVFFCSGLGIFSHFMANGFVMPNTLGTILCFYLFILSCPLIFCKSKKWFYVKTARLIVIASICIPYYLENFTFPYFREFVIAALLLTVVSEKRISPNIYYTYIAFLLYSGISVKDFPVWVQASVVFVIILGLLTVSAMYAGSKKEE